MIYFLEEYGLAIFAVLYYNDDKRKDRHISFNKAINCSFVIVLLLIASL